MFLRLKYWPISEITAQISNHTSELAIPIGISTKKSEEKMETYPVAVGAEINKRSIECKVSSLFVLFFIN